MHMGLFLLRSIYLNISMEFDQEKKFNSLVAKFCWHKHIALKISLFIWKLLHNGIPTDLAISNKGITITSKCHCCRIAPNSEFNTHLFINSEVGTAVWKFYANLLDINDHAQTIPHMLTKWWIKSKGSSLYAWLLSVLPCLIIWHIWKSRNKARFDNSDMDHNNIISAIKSQLWISSMLSKLISLLR